jgi:16S rRNA C967 or C1407 C5-methylase (RsmB/RsmF family)
MILNSKKLNFLFQHFEKIIFLPFSFNIKFSDVIKDYYSANKQLGSKDRKLLTELAFNYIRFKTSLEFNQISNIFDIFYIILNISKKVSDYLYTFSDFDEHLINFFSENHFSIEPKIKDFIENFDNSHKISFSNLYQNQINSLNIILYDILNSKSPVTIRPLNNENTLESISKILVANDIIFHRTPLNSIDIQSEKSLMNFIPQEKYDYEIQDNGSIVISKFISELNPISLFDACAGSGGKSLSVSSFNPNIKIDMYDSVKSRLNEFHKRNSKQYNNINLLYQLDQSKKYDVVLVDAPCSGSGTIRRTPDKKHTIDNDILNKFSQTQLSILNEYSKYVSKDGILIYVTCSLFDKENIEVINLFLETNPKFEPLEIQSETINNYSIKISNFANILIPIKYNGDVFFIATLKKKH